MAQEYLILQTDLLKEFQLIKPGAEIMDVYRAINSSEIDDDVLCKIVRKIVGEMRRDGLELERGDYIQSVPGKHRYRNSGTFAWDGLTIIGLACNDCDYGVPPFNVINEFPIQHWANVHDHNNFVYANLSQFHVIIRQPVKFGTVWITRAHFKADGTDFLLLDCREEKNVEDDFIEEYAQIITRECLSEQKMFSSACDDLNLGSYNKNHTIFNLML